MRLLVVLLLILLIVPVIEGEVNIPSELTVQKIMSFMEQIAVFWLTKVKIWIPRILSHFQQHS